MTVEAPAAVHRPDALPDIAPKRVERRSRRRSTRWTGWLWVLPALGMYGTFVLVPVAQTIHFSFYDWDGIGPSTWVGLDNYAKVLTDPALFNSILHAFVLILYFTVLPVGLGLVMAAVLREMASGAFGTLARTVLFLPQIIPLAGAGIAWSWMYSSDGLINQILRAIGLDSLAQPWLGGFDTALPAVGLIGTWVALGLCTVLLLAGIGKIDVSLYEAARLDGAGLIREFFAVTLPGLRHEIVVCVTVTVIAALASFDIIYVSTSGGPGYQTMVPSVAIYRLAFTQQQVGLASALAVTLAVLVVLVIAPIQRLGRQR
ncbi:MAG: sugar ABC transporter permease [Pseudonocardiales bacterium]|nr:MAG: sugar ABC transporter permease [Pseudonocardiales bacterium]